ncbi:MAG TPA: indole-3-glycerol phosphate synthase TrpC [Acidimicrobiia bacterium]
MLDRILEATRERVVDLRARRAAVMARAEEMPTPPSFRRALSESSALGVIAEIKRRSPSRGRLAADLDVSVLAGVYAAGGAVAISVLTEPAFFEGDPSDVAAAQESSGLPVLRKDFILESLQVWEARAMGASAVLLIAAALTPNELVGLLDDVEHAGLDAVVEVHEVEEARLARDLGARIVGVNNRDLGSFEVDLSVAETIAAELELAPLTVAESGIFTAADALRMKNAGYDAILVGEALVRSADPSRLIEELSV